MAGVKLFTFYFLHLTFHAAVAQLVERLASGETKVELARLNKVGSIKIF
jgi:hypothetical protein